MATLHTVNKSPFERSSLATCLRVATDGASLLLLEDGVYAALGEGRHADAVKDALGRVSVYVLAPDLAARGLADRALIDGLRLVDDVGFVRLVTQHERVVAWT